MDFLEKTLRISWDNNVHLTFDLAHFQAEAEAFPEEIFYYQIQIRVTGVCVPANINHIAWLLAKPYGVVGHWSDNIAKTCTNLLL